MTLDSSSVGQSDRFLTLTALAQRLTTLPGAPKDQGHLALVVRKGEGGRRESLDQVLLSPEMGVPGDAWGRRAQRDPEAQLATMQRNVAELIANGQPLTLFGDNLFLDLDLSAANLPPGSRLQVGEAILEVTPMPHDGCRKFRARFGDDALRFVGEPASRHLNLRGIYLRVVQQGEVRQGDQVHVLSRGTPLLPQSEVTAASV